MLEGGAGRDSLFLGAGADLAFGGAGSDRFVFRHEDMDGATDRIGDFSRSDGGRDRLDFRALDLLVGIDAEAWIAQNVHQAADGSVAITLLADTVPICGATTEAAAFYQEVCDGVLF